jgi:hypothetical protein
MNHHLELMRDTSVIFPSVSDPTSFESARIWHCKYTSLSRIASFTSLRSLEIATYPDDSFAPLADLSRLEKLHVTHLPKVGSLSELSALSGLRELRLATLPSWDSSGKVTTVESLLPLTQLPNLERLELFGVVTPTRSADELLHSKPLLRVSLSQYSEDSMERVRQRYAA